MLARMSIAMGAHAPNCTLIRCGIANEADQPLLSTVVGALTSVPLASRTARKVGEGLVMMTVPDGEAVGVSGLEQAAVDARTATANRRDSVMAKRPRVVVVLTVVALLAGASWSARAAATDTPILSETDRLRITNTLQAAEIAQLRAQAAQRDYLQAREQLRGILAGLERPGYVLDLQTLTYQAAPTSARPN